MKIAIFIKNNEITALYEENIRVVIFKIEKEKVVGVENEILGNQTKESIVEWLQQKSINQIYLSEIDESTHHKISSKGIRIRTLENLENDKLYNTLALSSYQLKKA